MVNYYAICEFKDLNNRMDSKFLYYNQNQKIKDTNKYPIVRLKKVMDLIKSPAVFEENTEYRYYDTSIDSVTEKGEFKNYKLITKENKPSRAKQVALNGTLIVANLKTNKSKAAIVTDKEAGSIISSGYLIIKPKDNIDIEYLQTILHSQKVIYYLRQICSTGLGMANWSYNDLANIKIPLPPIEEQRRTLPLVKEKIAKLQEKIKKLEKEKEENSLQNIIDRVLEKNGIEYKKPNVIKNTIYGSVDFQNSTRELSINKLLFDEQRVYRHLPQGYKVKTINKLISEGIIVDVKDGNHGELHPKSSEYVEAGIPFIMANDIHPNGKINFEACKKITQERMATLRTGFAQNGDILLTHKGSMGLTAIINNNDYPVVILSPQVTYYRLNNAQKIINKLYLYNFFKSSIFQDVLKHYAKQSTRDYVGITKQKTIKIIIPPYDIQHRINEEINNVISKMYDYKSKIKKLKNKIELDLNKYILEGYSEDLFELEDSCL